MLYNNSIQFVFTFLGPVICAQSLPCFTTHTLLWNYFLSSCFFLPFPFLLKIKGFLFVLLPCHWLILFATISTFSAFLLFNSHSESINDLSLCWAVLYSSAWKIISSLSLCIDGVGEHDVIFFSPEFPCYLSGWLGIVCVCAWFFYRFMFRLLLCHHHRTNLILEANLLKINNV